MKSRFGFFSSLSALTILILICTGCATFRIDDLKKDSLQGESDYTSLVFWNVNIRDYTTPEKWYPLFSVQWYDEDAREYKELAEGNIWVANFGLNTAHSLVQQSKKDGISITSGPVFKKAKPGKYRISYVRVNWTTGNFYNYLDAYVDKEFIVTPGSAHYLGSFDWDILKKENMQFNFNFKINQNENDLRASYAALGSKYPNLAAQFQNHVLLTYLTPITPRKLSRSQFQETFSDNSQGWGISKGQYYDMFFENVGSYVIETKNDKFTTSSIKRMFSADSDVELTSTWQKGRDDMPYGVLIGAHLFAVSKNGKAAVYRDNNGTYTLISGWADVKSLKNAKEVRQTIELSPESAAYFVNGEYVGRISMKLFNPSLGVVVAGQQKVSFKKLSISY